MLQENTPDGSARMTPNFALNLSEDGIVLLHRHPSGAGWVEIADAPLDSADLGAALSELRNKAEDIEGPDFTTKLILPPSQLLYATIQTNGDVKTDVEQALEERTPYSAAQLNYDISGEAPDVQVVAVARETLEEAEGFLGPYGFNPVGFTALPDPEHFTGTPNLGPLPSIGGQGVVDGGAFNILTAEDVAALEAPDAPVEDDTDEPSSAELATLDAPDLPADEDAATPEDSAADAEEDTSPAAATDTNEADTSDAPASDEPELPVTAPAAFSSRRKPTLGPATEATGELVTSRAPRIAIPTDVKNAPSKTKSAPRIEPRIKTGEAKKEKATPAIVPPAPVKTAAGPSKLESGVATLRATAQKAKAKRARKKEAAAAAAALEASADQTADPIADLAARQTRGKPRFLGLILTGLLIAALLLFAAMSSYILPEDSLSSLFGSEPDEAEISETVASLDEGTDFEESERLASLPDPSLGAEPFTVPSEEELAEAETPEPEILPLLPMTQTEAETAYAVSGVWQLAPDLRPEISRQDIDDLYESSLDPALAFEDAPALASFDAAAQALEFQTPSAPPAAAILRNLDARGLVQATRNGTENPDGIMIFAGRPPVEPLRRPADLVPDTAPEAEETAAEETEEEEENAPFADPNLAGFKPAQRPSDLQEQFERATQGGRSNLELARIRPQLRPESAQAEAEAKAREEAIARALAEAETQENEEQQAEARAAAEAAAQAELDKPTAQAVAQSARPSGRPRNFARVVARARRADTEERSTPGAAASTAAVARGTGPAVVRSSRATPTGTTGATVARAATDNNAIALGKVALVGVFGTSSNRRALVRMPNGRFKKVGVGDKVDGGRVAAIGEGQLKYTKGSRTLTLQMPKG